MISDYCCLAVTILMIISFNILLKKAEDKLHSDELQEFHEYHSKRAEHFKVKYTSICYLAAVLVVYFKNTTLDLYNLIF